MRYEEGYYGLEHSSDARDVIEAFAKMRASKAETVTEAVVSKYVQSEGIPNGNVNRLMGGVEDAVWYVPSTSVREHFANIAARSPGLAMKTHYVRSMCNNKAEARSFVNILGGKQFALDVVKQ